MALYTVKDTILTIKNHNMDGVFVGAWIDSIETMSTLFHFYNIRTLVLDSVQLDDTVAYDIFDDFPNITELRVINSTFTSKKLNNLLIYLNPYSLGTLDLSGSHFNNFNLSDFKPIKSLIGIGTLTLPSDMDLEVQNGFKKAVGYHK